MKQSSFPLLLFLILLSQHVYSFPVQKKIVQESQELEAQDKLVRKHTRKLDKQKIKAEKRAKKHQKRIDRIKKFLEKRGIQPYGVLDNFKFRLGVIALIGALAIGLVRLFITLGGLLGLLTGILALAGVVLVVWGLIEIYG